MIKSRNNRGSTPDTKEMVWGLTLPELLITLGILLTVFVITTVNLLSGARTTTQVAFIDTFTTDLRDQQNKAMAQFAQGESQNFDYGVYLTENSYVLFRGSIYNAGDPDNFVINLNPGLNFSAVTFPSSTILFESGTGQLVGFASGSNSLTLNDSVSQKSLNLTFNRYGVPLE